jgi:hypothetical protein
MLLETESLYFHSSTKAVTAQDLQLEMLTLQKETHGKLKY